MNTKRLVMDICLVGCAYMVLLRGAQYISSAAADQTQTHLADSHILTKLYDREYDPSWIKLAWTGDDAPYQAARVRIDGEFASGTQPNEIRLRHRDEAEARPNDPLAQFIWLYSAWVACHRPYDVNEKTEYLYDSEVSQSIARAPYPRTYNFARIRFLAEPRHHEKTTDLLAQEKPLIALGEKLLAQDPRDEPVLLRLLTFYETVITWKRDVPVLPAGYQERAFALVKQYGNLRFHDHRYYLELGDVYEACFYRSQNPDEARKALAAFDAYRLLAPADDPSSDDVFCTEKLIKAALNPARAAN